MELTDQQGSRTEWPYLNLGKLLFVEGQYKDALELAQQASEMNPRSAEAFYVQGKILQKLGKDTEALEVLERSVLNDPKFSEAHYLMGRIYLKQGRKRAGQEKMELFRSLKQQEPKKSVEISVK